MFSRHSCRSGLSPAHRWFMVSQTEPTAQSLSVLHAVPAESSNQSHAPMTGVDQVFTSAIEG